MASSKSEDFELAMRCINEACQSLDRIKEATEQFLNQIGPTVTLLAVAEAEKRGEIPRTSEN